MVHTVDSVVTVTVQHHPLPAPTPHLVIYRIWWLKRGVFSKLNLEECRCTADWSACRVIMMCSKSYSARNSLMHLHNVPQKKTVLVCSSCHFLCFIFFFSTVCTVSCTKASTYSIGLCCVYTERWVFVFV